MDSILWLVLVAAGLLLAVVGRRLFWLAVGLAGFGLGYFLFGVLFPDVIDSDTVRFVVALIIGVVGALVAVRGFPLLATGLAAVLLALLGMQLASLFTDSSVWLWIGFALGAVLGVVIMRTMLDVGLRLVTALGGAALVMRGLSLEFSWNETVLLLIGLAVAVAGYVIQLPDRNKPADAVPPPAAS